MTFLGNLIWIIFGGLLLSVVYLILGVAYCISIIGIPVGLQLFKMAKLSLYPFGHTIKDKEDKMGCLTMGLNILWIIFGGIEMAMSHALAGLLFCITIVGIPFGLQHFKLALLALMPFGKEIE